MRGSATHDALYVLIPPGVLGQTELKDRRNLSFIRILEEDGMPRLRRMYAHQGVRQFGMKELSKRGIKEVHSSS
jgi:hypothetical protein